MNTEDEEEWVPTDEEATGIITRLFAALDRGDRIESSELDATVGLLIFLNSRYPELDQEFARRLHQFDFVELDSYAWQAVPMEIIEGVFPLEEIPEHVRPIIEELYYTNKKTVDRK